MSDQRNVIRREAPAGLRMGERLARVGWLQVELADQHKEQDEETFAFPVPCIIVGSPQWEDQHDLIGAMQLEPSTHVYSKLDFQTGGSVELTLFRSFEIVNDKPDLPDENPQIETIPLEEKSGKVQLLSVFTFTPARSSELMQYDLVRDYAKNSDKFFVDGINTTGADIESKNAYRMIMSRYKMSKDGRTFWYRRKTVQKMGVPLQQPIF